MGLLLLVGTIAFLLATLLTPMVRGAARRFGIVDKPDQLRKLQSNAIALGGGLAVLAAFVITCGIALVTAPEAATYVRNNWQLIFAIATSFIAVSIVGFIDDGWTIRGRQKLFAQMVIGLFLCLSGLQIEHIRIFSFDIHLGWMAIPVTLIWLAGTSNALNLIDGSDGLCSTVGIIICAAISAMAYMGGHQAEALMGAAMAGALLGFLIFNFPPASIYSVDSSQSQGPYNGGRFCSSGFIGNPTLRFEHGHFASQAYRPQHLRSRSSSPASQFAKVWFKHQRITIGYQFVIRLNCTWRFL